MSLNKIRNEIDELDKELVRILKKRMDLAIKSKEYKSNIEDLGREGEIANNLKTLASKYKLDFDYLTKIYQVIFSEGKKRQNEAD